MCTELLTPLVVLQLHWPQSNACGCLVGLEEHQGLKPAGSAALDSAPHPLLVILSHQCVFGTWGWAHHSFSCCRDSPCIPPAS